MIRSKSLVILLSALVLIACGHSLRVRDPFIVVRFEEVSLVVESATSPEEEFLIREGTLQFVVDESLDYRPKGAGRFSVRGVEFLYDPPELTCQCSRTHVEEGRISSVRLWGA